MYEGMTDREIMLRIQHEVMADQKYRLIELIDEDREFGILTPEAADRLTELVSSAYECCDDELTVIRKNQNGELPALEAKMMMQLEQRFVYDKVIDEDTFSRVVHLIKKEYAGAPESLKPGFGKKYRPKDEREFYIYSTLRKDRLEEFISDYISKYAADYLMEKLDDKSSKPEDIKFYKGKAAALFSLYKQGYIDSSNAMTRCCDDNERNEFKCLLDAD